jgi:hypothetical protein
MASSNSLRVITLPNGNSSFAANLFLAVDVNSSGNPVLPSAGGSIVGVVQNDDAINLNDPISIGFIGASQWYAGGTVASGNVLKTNASGQCVACNATDIAAGSGTARCIQGASSGQVAIALLGTMGVANSYVGGDETVTSGNLSAYTVTSYISVTGTQAYTLPNGVVNGQRKRIECSVASTTPAGTLTITTPFTGEQATYFFDFVGQMIELEWRAATGWHIVSKRRAGTAAAGAIVVGTTNIGGSDLHSEQNLSVTGTVASSLANGNVPGERVYFYVTTAASTPSGKITGAFLTKLGVTSTGWGQTTAITTTGAYVGVEWDGAAWREILPTAVAAF